jgi:carbamoyl-phosphate synthase large subunit
VRRGVPCVTTVAGLAAAVQGIEATIRGEVGVRSLQEHAASLRRRGDGGLGKPPMWGVTGGSSPGGD